MLKTILVKLAGSIAILTALLMTGCSTVRHHRDGPPPCDVDVSRIPNAVPKHEALAKYGNMASYKVFGKKYHVMPSASHYREKGIASWYGMQFHQRRTSSGERYDLLAMTAAHKSLPLPTYVEVTNLENNRKVIVKVNDRGPFCNDRIIDLSYVAAKKLGMLGHGTAHVEVKAINTNLAPSFSFKNFLVKRAPTRKLSPSVDNTVHTACATSKMYLQVGAFHNKLHAEKLKKRLQTLTSTPVNIARPTRTLYQVKIGPFRDVATAEKISKKLHMLGLSANHVKA